MALDTNELSCVTNKGFSVLVRVAYNGRTVTVLLASILRLFHGNPSKLRACKFDMLLWLVRLRNNGTRLTLSAGGNGKRV